MPNARSLTEKLHEIARNLFWTWTPEVRAIFREIDAPLWRAVHHNPIAFLKRVPPAEIEERVGDLELHARIDRALRQLEEYLAHPGAWGLAHAGALRARPVAYFCAEFGLHESIPIYSGGLGVLAGDHLRAASDLGVPLVGVGLLYHQGYTHQQLDASGWQEDVMEPVDLDELPIEPARDASGAPARISVEFPGRRVFAKVMEAKVGRVRVFLLDARDEANSEADRGITARLYGGDQRTRIQQELLLGIGGMRALRAVGIRPSVLHFNEGHTVFAILERARELVSENGIPPWNAIHEAGAASVFTTHTPVEAGHDYFPNDLAAEHLAPIAGALGLTVGDVLGLGRYRPEDPHGTFCPTIFALRLASRKNGVSALHGAVARRMWQGLFGARRESEVPIGHVTNGVHVGTWLAPEVAELLARHVGPGWPQAVTRPEIFAAFEQVDDAELWEVTRVLKARFITFVRRRVAAQRARLGLPPIEPPPLDPEILTIGFARRFATYKRSTLLFDDLDRMAALVRHPERPIQIVFAGRAHPSDEGGKRLIQRIARLADDERFRGRIVFVENHNIHLGRQLYQGCDAWLNTPRRPLEACGTSGMKAMLNAGLNISVLDGWWAEAWDGENGFAIGTGEVHTNPEEQDRRDREAAFRTIEEEVAPLFYDRDAAGVPRRWLERVKRAYRTLAWRFNADRMLMDYVRECYLPAANMASCRMPSP
jgi:starch phosphorylase